MSDENRKACPTVTAVQNDLPFAMSNYDEANIVDVRNAWDEERKNPSIVSRQVYTMVQANAACEVEITQESRKACVEALLR